VKSDPLQPSGRHDIPSRRSTVQASSVRTTRTFCPDLLLCREALNYNSLHPSGRFSSTSGHHSVFDQLWDFFPKHKYGKIVATVRTMWIPVQTRSSIGQVTHSKIKTSGRQSSWSGHASYIYENCVHQINRPDGMSYGPDARSLDMEIACS
jgi:hypothetical protein